MLKLVASSQLRSSFLETSRHDPLMEAIDRIEMAILKHDISETSPLGMSLLEIIHLINNAQDQFAGTDDLISRASSNTSTASLGDRIAIHDKENFLYTYSWTSRNGEYNSWIRGNAFKSWAENPYSRLPAANSKLRPCVLHLLLECGNISLIPTYSFLRR